MKIHSCSIDVPRKKDGLVNFPHVPWFHGLNLKLCYMLDSLPYVVNYHSKEMKCVKVPDPSFQI